MTTKYHNQPVVIDGIRFDSKLEARRWQELKLMEAAGEIATVHPHPRYDLRVDGVLVGHYTADSLQVMPSGRIVVEDVKSGPTITTACRLRLKLMKACHGIEVQIWPPRPPRKPRQKRPSAPDPATSAPKPVRRVTGAASQPSMSAKQLQEYYKAGRME
jgi:hypothetical protein